MTTIAIPQKLTSRILIACHISSNENAGRRFVAQVDTGAEITCISPRVVAELGLKQCGTAVFTDFECTKRARQYLINIALFPCDEFCDVKVDCVNLPGIDVLVGMDILSNLDFSYSLVDGRPVFRMRYPHSSDPIT